MVRWREVVSCLVLVCSGAVSVTGCATPCTEIAQHRDAFIRNVQQPTVPATAEPHLIAVLPFEMINGLIAPQVQSIEPLPLQIPGAGLLGTFLTDVRLGPRQVQLMPSDGPGVGIELILDVTQGGNPLFSMTARGTLQPQLDPQGRRIVVELRATDFQSMEPTLDQGAAARLADTLMAILPPMARMVISPEAIASGATIVTEVIVSQSYPLLRDSLFAALGPLARLEISLPDLPVERLEFATATSQGRGHLVIRAHTPLPVRFGVTSSQLPAPAGNTAALWLSGSTVAQLANWAMAEGQLPRSFDERGRPQADGPYEARLDWISGDRPLVVHIWRLEPDRCLRAVLSAQPQLRVEGEDIVLEVDDPHVDELDGPAMSGLVRLFSGLWLRAMRLTQSTAASLEFSVGGRPLRGQVTEVRQHGDEIQMTLRLVEAPPAR